MKTEKTFVGAVVLDSLPFSLSGTATQAKALKSTGVDAIVGYLGAINSARLSYILDAGMAFMPVTYAADAFGGDTIVKRCNDLGLSKNVTVWQDLEGIHVFQMEPLALRSRLNVASLKVQQSGFMPGVYIGAPQPLTSEELFSLTAVRYWKGIGRCVDRFGKLAEPTCGWSMVQLYHGEKNAMGMTWRDLDPTQQGRVWKDTGVFVDPNMIGADYQGRVPNWVVA